MKLTPWFSGDQKPVRPGVYERDYTGAYGGIAKETQYSAWDGADWYAGAWTQVQAEQALQEGVLSDFQNRCWRGILRNGK